MNTTFKRLLLAGTTIAALFHVPAGAFAADGLDVTTSQTLNGSYTGSNGTAGATDTDGNPGFDGVKYTGGNAGTLQVTNNGTLHGGQGGAGGPRSVPGDNAQTGGQGGNGVNIPVSGTDGLPGDFPALNNNAGHTITGGTGGAGGVDYTENGFGGIGGTGVLVGGDFTDVANDGTISGGLGGNSVSNGGVGGIGGIGINILSASVNIQNSSTGIITGGAGGSGFLDPTPDGAYGDGIDVSGTGSVGVITNSGLIHADGDPAYGQPAASAILVGGSGTLGTIKNYANITGTGGANAVYNNGIITDIDNRGTISTDSGVAIYNGGTMGITNTGTISATTGTAVQLGEALSASLGNSGGLITSASTTNGTIYITNDIGNQAFGGGTISNTDTSNAGIAINVAYYQSGGNFISFSGVNIISDGDTAGSGHGVAFNLDGGGGEPIGIALDSSTVVRGAINAPAGDNITLTTAASVIGNITFGSGDDTINFNGGSIAGDIAYGQGTNIFTANGAFTTDGTISAASGYAWNLNVANGGSFTVASDQDLGTFGGGPTGGGTIDVMAGGALNVTGGNMMTGGIFTNNGTTTIGSGHVLTAGSGIDNTATGTLIYNVSNTGSTLLSGHIDAGSAPADLSHQAVQVHYIGGTGLNGTSRSLIATGSGAAVLPTAVSTNGNSYMYDFDVVAGTGGTLNNLYLQLVQLVTPQNAADRGNNANASRVLTGDLASSNDPQITRIQSNLANAPTRQSYNNVLEATLPTVDNGAPMAAAGFTGQVFDVADSQLAMVNTGDPTGIAAGDKAYGLHPWIQGFGQHANQDSRSGVDGYKANTFGGAVGMDTRSLDFAPFGDNNIVGVSFAYGDTFVNSSNANATDTRVNTYQGTLYGNHAFGKTDYFVAGMAAFGYDRNQASRHDVGGIAGLDADSSYNSYQEAGRFEAGKNFRLAGDFAGAILTPIASADYVHYDAESYNEHGAGGADLHVGHQDEDVLNFGIGGRAEWLLHTGGGMQVKPDIHASYQYNVLNTDKVNTNSSFAAGGSTFSTNGLNPSNSTFDVGAGVKLYNAGRWDFTATYDFTAKPDYTANSGMVRAAYKF